VLLQMNCIEFKSWMWVSSLPITLNYHPASLKVVHQSRSNNIHRLYNINTNLNSSHLASSFAEESKERNRNGEC